MQRKQEKATVEVGDSLSVLPVELHHEIIAWLFRYRPASVACLDATNTTLHASVRSAYISVESWAHGLRMRAGVLPITRLACATGAKSESDAMTGLAIAVMYAYVAGSMGEKECWYNRGLESRDSQIPEGDGPLIERLGLPRPNSASPDALVEWITSNHRALDRQTGPSLFPAVVYLIERDVYRYFAPTTMGKYWACHILAPRAKDILRVGGPLDRDGCARETFQDTDKFDLLFGLDRRLMEPLIDLPRSTTMRVAYFCDCQRKSTTCKTCRCLGAVTDALDRPETERRALAWIDKRTADHLPADIASCIADCPQLGLAFTDLFCVSDMHAVRCLDIILFFGIVRPRFDVDAFLASASRLRNA